MRKYDWLALTAVLVLFLMMSAPDHAQPSQPSQVKATRLSQQAKPGTPSRDETPKTYYFISM